VIRADSENVGRSRSALALNGDEVHDSMLHCAPTVPALLGAVALEVFSSQSIPVGKRLIPVDGFVG